MSVYGTRTISRLTKAQAVELDRALLEIAEQERPTSVRGMYYQAIAHDLVDKDQANKKNNYRRVQRRILRLDL